MTGRPPDEPSVIGEVFNDLALPVVRQQIPEIRDLWLPPAACSYRIAVVSIDKRYPGQARRVMMALWGMLPQFSYTKMLVVVDDDIDARNWDDVAWALATRMDPARDVMMLDRTPMDYLDFASPQRRTGGQDRHRRHHQDRHRNVPRMGPGDDSCPPHVARAEALLAQHLQRARA